jgi:uncharacterized protein (DUF305 family)
MVATKCKKVYFVDEKNALMYINKLKKTSSRERKPVNAYLCQHCLNWHLTSIELKEVSQVKNLESQIKNLKEKIARQKTHIEGMQKKLMIDKKINLFL